MDQQVNPMFHQDRLMQHLGAHLVSFGEHSAQIVAEFRGTSRLIIK
ncbi:hypothetical protein [Acinetobacter sp. AND/436]